MGLERKGFFMPFVREQSGGTPEISAGASSSATISSATIGNIYIYACQGSNSCPTITGGTIIAQNTFSTPVGQNWLGWVLVIKATSTTITMTHVAPNSSQYNGSWLYVN